MFIPTAIVESTTKQSCELQKYYKVSGYICFFRFLKILQFILIFILQNIQSYRIYSKISTLNPIVENLDTSVYRPRCQKIFFPRNSINEQGKRQ